MNNPKVIFVFHQTKSQANGGVNSLWQLIKSFDGITPVLLTNAHTKVVEEAKSLGFEVLITANRDSFSIGARIYNLFFWSISLLSILLKQRVKAIHFNDIIALSYGIFAAKLIKFFSTQLKLVLNIRDVFEPGQSYTKKWRLVNYCDEIIVLSTDMKEQLFQRLPIKNKTYWQYHMHSIYSVVDLERFSPISDMMKEALKRRLLMNDKSLHWAYVATFNTKKNQLGFIEALQEQLKAHQVIIHFVGDINAYALECQERVKTLGLQDKVVFHGYNTNIEDFYHAADVTIVPTKREGLARCMIESLACGAAVVSFEVSSAKEILVDHNCGKVIPQGDYEALFKEALCLSRNTVQQGEITENGRNLAIQLFSKPAIVASYRNVYLN